MRLFFAFVPEISAADKIARLRSALCLEGASRLVSQSDLHMTLAFLGDVAESQVGDLEAFAGRQRSDEFELCFDQLEFWPKSAAIVTIAGTVPSPLAALWRRFQSTLRLQAREPFLPHVTLARKVPQAPVLTAISPIHWSPRAFSLLRSDSGGAQSAYTVLGTWPLLYES